MVQGLNVHAHAGAVIDDPALLRQRLRRAETRQRLRAYALVLPLFVFHAHHLPRAHRADAGRTACDDPLAADSLPRSAPLLAARCPRARPRPTRRCSRRWPPT
jgi:hypothetical protein